MGVRARRAKRALEVTRAARRGRILRVLREIGAPRAEQRTATRESAREFRGVLEELGVAYVKLGQLLSSRPDLLPDVYIEELVQLVDHVQPVPFEHVEPAILADLGADAFVRLEREPLATASIGQIHAGLLHDGREVVVKVRRPGIEEQIALDLDLLRSTAHLVERRSRTARLLQVEALADELEAHLSAECDFEEEAWNAELIGGQLADVPEIVVPRPVRPYVTSRVLVLERVHGEKVAPGHGLEPERAQHLARQFFRAYVRQVCVEGVYHADPHRGNVLLTDDGRLALLDFGLLGRLDDDTRRTLALLLIAIAQNRADDVAHLILSLSLTTLETREAQFLHELRRRLPRYHWRPLSGVRSGEALADLQRLAVRYGIRLPPSFALVGKTLSQADSIARALDPDLDPVEVLRDRSYEILLAEAERRLEPARLVGSAFGQLQAVSRLPTRVAQIADRLETGTLRVGIVPAELDKVDHVIRSSANRMGAALIVAALLLSSSLMARVDDLVAIVGFAIAGLIALVMIYRIFRTPGGL